MNIQDVSLSISDPGSENLIVGMNVTLECNVVVIVKDAPKPVVEWSYNNASMSLPSGVTELDAVHTGDAYVSTLRFSPLQASHAGMYTCRLGDNSKPSASISVSTSMY